MKKVYCKNCKYCYFPYINGSYYKDPYCLKLEYYKDTPFDRVLINVSCEEGETNKKNNCPNYKRKWYKFWIKQA